MRRSRHPIVAVFTVLFKIAALFVYVFCGIFTDSFIISFITCTLLLSCDFWTVKNVSGRLLVGFRYWSSTNSDGSTKWSFESLSDRSAIARFDSYVFWGSLAGALCAWLLLALVAALKLNLDWLLIPAVAIALTGANLVGYIKCRGDHKAKLSGMRTAITSSLGSAIFHSVSQFADDEPDPGPGSSDASQRAAGVRAVAPPVADSATASSI